MENFTRKIYFARNLAYLPLKKTHPSYSLANLWNIFCSVLGKSKQIANKCLLWAGRGIYRNSIESSISIIMEETQIFCFNSFLISHFSLENKLSILKGTVNKSFLNFTVDSAESYIGFMYNDALCRVSTVHVDLSSKASVQIRHQNKQLNSQDTLRAQLFLFFLNREQFLTERHRYIENSSILENFHSWFKNPSHTRTLNKKEPVTNCYCEISAQRTNAFYCTIPLHFTRKTFASSSW